MIGKAADDGETKTRVSVWRREARTRWSGMPLVLAMLASALAGCALDPVPRPRQVAWGDRVPEAAAEDVAAQPVVARGPISITLLPISPTGAAVGIDYAYDMPHCGFTGPIDVDGSFWDAVGIAPNAVAFDGLEGTFRLASPMEATFTSSRGNVLHLVRRSGTKAFRICS